MKMKKSAYKTGVILLITLFFVSFASNAEEVTKEFHKEYKASASTTLEISNKYGDVVVQNWDKDQVVIDVKVTVEMSSREKAEKVLNSIEIQFNEGLDLISAKTVFTDNFNFSGWGNSSRKFRIDYTVKMPTATALTLSNRYGDADIADLSGLVNLDIKYGNLAAGKLSRGNVKPWNKLNIGYGKATIDEVGWLDFYVRYAGKTEIAKSQAILLDSKYSTLALGSTNSLVGESKYDNIRIDNINNLDLENGYTEVRIGELVKKLNYTGSYGSFTIESIPAGFESLSVDTRYMGVRLGISDAANYRLEAKVSYGGLSYNEERFKNERRIVQNNSNEVAGNFGSSDAPASRVNVSASYGSVKLY
jgi:hypothetical protein